MTEPTTRQAIDALKGERDQANRARIAAECAAHRLREDYYVPASVMFPPRDADPEILAGALRCLYANLIRLWSRERIAVLVRWLSVEEQCASNQNSLLCDEREWMETE